MSWQMWRQKLEGVCCGLGSFISVATKGNRTQFLAWVAMLPCVPTICRLIISPHCGIWILLACYLWPLGLHFSTTLLVFNFPPSPLGILHHWNYESYPPTGLQLAIKHWTSPVLRPALFYFLILYSPLPTVEASWHHFNVSQILVFF